MEVCKESNLMLVSFLNEQLRLPESDRNPFVLKGLLADCYLFSNDLLCHSKRTENTANRLAEIYKFIDNIEFLTFFLRDKSLEPERNLILNNCNVCILLFGGLDSYLILYIMYF